MTRLTEDMVIARTKSSELGAVKKLNCWGSDLVDVSLVKRLSNVEVLSLSLNKIQTLADFQFCRNLVELYIRRNAIRDLSELCYLQELPRLRRLLLAENPCVDTAGTLYRSTVLRALPHLEVLDNNEVTPEELEQALRVGLILEHPLNRRERGSPESYYKEDSPTITGRRNSNANAEYEEILRRSTMLSRTPPSSEYNSPYIHQQQCEVVVVRDRNSPEESSSSNSQSEHCSSGGLRHRRNSVQSVGSSDDRGGVQPPGNNNSATTTTTPAAAPTNLPSPTSAVMRKVQRSPTQDPPHYNHPQQLDYDNSESVGFYNNRSEQGRGGGGYNNAEQHQQQQYYEEQQQSMNRQNPIPPRYSGGRGIKSRSKSSNLLSAVLCLIPELDWASLEVVELAVRRRMDELVDD